MIGGSMSWICGVVLEKGNEGLMLKMLYSGRLVWWQNIIYCKGTR